eukprot:Selendium_serpulae@DN2171_c0_g1_i1.p1
MHPVGPWHFTLTTLPRHLIRRGRSLPFTTLASARPKFQAEQHFKHQSKSDEHKGRHWLIGSTGAATALLYGFSWSPSSQRTSLCESPSHIQTTTFSWGNGIYGQLGLGDLNNRAVPQPLETFSGLDEGEEIAKCSAGGNSTACITTAGKAFTWGGALFNRLGHGALMSAPSVTVPKEISSLLMASKVNASCPAHVGESIMSRSLKRDSRQFFFCVAN